ncbi:MAG: CBS domain-containing protein [Methanobacteriota archaeon]|nr:MAG: CBS domain-containing protein [Euryarchaeota archaeon]
MEAGKLTLRDIVRTFELPMVPPDATIMDAMKKMIEANCYSILVPRSNKNDAYGILTKRDIISKVIAEGKDPAKVKVKEFMSKPLVLLTNLSLDLRWVANAMANSKVGTIAVFEKGDFYGYVTESCLLDGIYHAMRRTKIDQGIEFATC